LSSGTSCAGERRIADRNANFPTAGNGLLCSSSGAIATAFGYQSSIATRFSLAKLLAQPVITWGAMDGRNMRKHFADLQHPDARRNVSHTGALLSIGLER